MGSGLCYVVMSWCVEKRGPVFTAAFSPLIQIIVAIIDVTLLHEQLHLGRWVYALLTQWVMSRVWRFWAVLLINLPHQFSSAQHFGIFLCDHWTLSSVMGQELGGEKPHRQTGSGDRWEWLRVVRAGLSKSPCICVINNSSLSSFFFWC